MKERDDGPAAPSDGTFERILERALHSPEIMAAVERVGVPDTRERLRAEALQARPRSPDRLGRVRPVPPTAGVRAT